MLALKIQHLSFQIMTEPEYFSSMRNATPRREKCRDGSQLVSEKGSQSLATF
jgi:hypothetical protein